jgi:hypothetical protein
MDSDFLEGMESSSDVMVRLAARPVPAYTTIAKLTVGRVTVIVRRDDHTHAQLVHIENGLLPDGWSVKSFDTAAAAIAYAMRALTDTLTDRAHASTYSPVTGEMS